jgi:hypothetical protein
MKEVGAEKAEIFSMDGAWCIELTKPKDAGAAWPSTRRSG